jgi:type II secretory ATPase GspE/PulE/Tfp pilus assembly ATPase PilB-like protein
MPTLNVYWNRAQDDSWAEFFAVDLDDPHFDGLEGVFVVWQGGSQPAAIKVGSGSLSRELKALRADPAMALFRGKPLFVAWAKVEKVVRDGVTRYLFETLKPRAATAVGSAAAISVNLPGRGDEAPPDVEAPAPRQIFEQPGPLEAAPAPEKAREPAAKSPALQEELDKRLAGRAVNEEKLSGDVMLMILRSALALRATDVHLEPLEAHLRVRFRIDGLLEEVLRVKNSSSLGIVANIRLACGLDPEKGPGGRPEDGRVSIKIDGREADVRLSTFPTPFGDKAVLRVTPRASAALKLDELGLEPDTAGRLRALLARPQGLILVTGPAAGGKTATLYACLDALNDASRSIVTLEDPVERKLPGIAQGTILPKQGFGFAEGLRAALRQDPNVIMVGEVRDRETAELALDAALTGRLVLTVFHAASALGAVKRMLDMGLEPSAIASGLAAVSAQRLARAVCPSCARVDRPVEELSAVETLAAKAGLKLPRDLANGLKTGAGCGECRGTGYRGRILLFELLAVGAPLREAVLRKGGADELRAAAVRGGLEPLLLDGLRKAAAGRTTLAEVLRVVDAVD